MLKKCPSLCSKMCFGVSNNRKIVIVCFWSSRRGFVMIYSVSSVKSEDLGSVRSRDWRVMTAEMTRMPFEFPVDLETVVLVGVTKLGYPNTLPMTMTVGAIPTYDINAKDGNSHQTSEICSIINLDTCTVGYKSRQT